MQNSWYVYIATNHQDTTLYVGVTNNLSRRAGEHKYHTDPKSFSARYKLYKIVWTEEFSDPMDAIAAEKRIKGWRRDRKLELIKKDNPALKNLAALR